jgi:hypothetical protein
MINDCIGAPIKIEKEALRRRTKDATPQKKIVSLRSTKRDLKTQASAFSQEKQMGRSLSELGTSVKGLGPTRQDLHTRATTLLRERVRKITFEPDKVSEFIHGIKH